MGGLDLCFGRMDTSDHNLNANSNEFPGVDYFNPRICDFLDGRNHSQCLIDRDTQPRMPWHDVGLLLQGDIVKDLTRHFI